MPRLRLFGGSKEKAVIEKDDAASSTPTSDVERNQKRPPKWSFGVLNDKETDEVPGSVLLLSKVNKRNEPLGLRHAPSRGFACKSGIWVPKVQAMTSPSGFSMPTQSRTCKDVDQRIKAARPGLASERI